jgi:hypothetical protein
MVKVMVKIMLAIRENPLNPFYQCSHPALCHVLRESGAKHESGAVSKDQNVNKGSFSNAMAHAERDMVRHFNHSLPLTATIMPALWAFMIKKTA